MPVTMFLVLVLPLPLPGGLTPRSLLPTAGRKAPGYRVWTMVRVRVRVRVRVGVRVRVKTTVMKVPDDSPNGSHQCR